MCKWVLNDSKARWISSVSRQASSAEKIPLDIFYEDERIIVIDKPVGMLVHPVHGRNTGPLVNALLHHCNKLSAGEV